MYPHGDLIRLTAHKAALRQDIALSRNQCAEAAAQVARPLEWRDRVVAWWRRLSPLAKCAAVPLGILVQRAVLRRRKFLRSLARWGPLVVGAVRVFRSAVKPGNTHPPRRPRRTSKATPVTS